MLVPLAASMLRTNLKACCLMLWVAGLGALNNL